MALGPASSTSATIQTQLAKQQYEGMDSLVRITEKLVQQVREKQARDRIPLESDRQWLEAHREKAKLASFKARIADNVSVLTKASGAINWVERHLGDMKLALQGLNSASTAEERAAAAKTFDEARDKLNSAVNGASQQVGYQTVNLVGNAKGPGWKTDDIYTPVNRSGGSVRVEGAYLGAEFVIEDAEGDIWRLEDGGGAFVEYSSNGARTGNQVSTDGLTVDSYDSETGAITYGGSGTLSGTLNRGGVGVLSSEYYNDFADDDSVAEAMADVEAGLVLAQQKGANIQAQSSLIEGNNSMITEKIAQLSQEIFDRVQLNVEENAAVKKSADLKISLVVNNLNMVSSASQGLIENMMSLTQGPPKAGGLFGMMGY